MAAKANLGETHLNHIFDSARQARTLGLPKFNVADIERDFDAYRAFELGWYNDLCEADFVALMKEDFDLSMEHAKGQDLDWHYKRRDVIEDILKAGNWTIDMDTGKPMQVLGGRSSSERDAMR